MRHLLLTIVVITIFQTSFSQKSQARLLVFTPEKEKISITQQHLTDFVKKWYWIVIEFSELKVESLDNSYFLLAKDETNKRTFAFRLTKREGNFYLTPSPYVNICTCDCMELANFIIEKGEIMGCRKSKHAVVSGL